MEGLHHETSVKWELVSSVPSWSHMHIWITHTDE